MSSFGDLEQCIRANVSPPSNEIRCQAESHLKQLKAKSPQLFFEGLCNLLQKCPDDQVRSFSAVLLKQNLGIFDDTFFNIPQSSQNALKHCLLQQLKQESDVVVTAQICDCIAGVISLVSQNNRNTSWNELMPFLMELAKSTSAAERTSFFISIDKLACNAVDVLRMQGSMQDLRDMLSRGLQDTCDAVRESALSAVVSLLCEINEADELHLFHQLIPLLFSTINVGIGDKTICKTCQRLQMLADNQAAFFATCIKNIVECLVAVTQASTLDWDTRKLSMTLLTTLLQAHCNQIQNNLFEVAKQVVPLVFAFLSTFDDTDVEWNSPDDDDEQYHYQFGAELLPEMVSIFGPDIFLTIAEPLFKRGFANNKDGEWRATLQALKTVEVSLEACAECYESQLAEIVAATSQALQHSVPYVQYAALAVIKQLSVVFGDDKNVLLLPYHAQLMQPMAAILGNFGTQHRCVLIACCDALAQFAYVDEENEVMTQYATKLMDGLLAVLSKCDDARVRCLVLKAISVVCSVLHDEFAPFYGVLMKFNVQLLQDIFNGVVRDENGALRGRVMECIGQMLLVSDAEVCRPDAHNVIKFLLPFQAQEQKQADSESYTFMMPLFASIAEVLSAEFVPYIEHVMPPLLASAQKKIVISVGESKDNEHNGVITEEFNGIAVRVNTADLNEKVVALQQFPRYAVCLEGALLAYVRPVSNVLMTAIRTRSVSSETRRHAIEAMAPLTHCLQSGLASKGVASKEVAQWVTTFVVQILASLIEAMNMSDQVDEFALVCKSMHELLDYVDVSLVKDAKIVAEITEQIATAIQERQVRREMNEEQSMELMDAEIEDDVEADLFNTMVDLVTKLVRVFGDAYVPMFDRHCGRQCLDFIRVGGNNDNNNNGGGGKQVNEDDQILAVSLLTELVRFGGSVAAQKYVSPVLQFAQHYFTTNNTEADVCISLQQQISYSVGVVATLQKLNAQNVPQWLTLLKQIVAAPKARNDENVNATENAISAIAKVLKSYCGDDDNIFVEWMQMLPLTHDTEEREFCNEYLLEVLQKRNVLKNAIESQNGAFIAKLIEAMAVAISNDDKAKPQFMQLFNHLKSQCDVNVIQQCVQTLPQDLCNAFQ